MAEEALQCFENLLDKVPTWLADLESILNDTSARQHELVAASRVSGPSSFLAKIRAMSKSSMTLRSRRSRRSKEAPAVGGIRKSQMNSSNAAHPSQRQHKPASSLSSSDSGPGQTRTRSTLPVYYDGEVQSRFENLVRAVGGSRNTLRKGKMGAKLDGMTRTGSSSSASSDDASDDDVGLTFSPKTFLPKRAAFTPFQKQDYTKSFDQVDGILDKTQACCEKAAHQLLRNGDCRSDLIVAKEQLLNAQQLLESELPLWQKKANKAALRRRRSEERQRQEETDVTEKEQTVTLTNALTLPSETGLAADLEADDTDESEEPEISLSSLRLPPKRQPYRPPHHLMGAAC